MTWAASPAIERASHFVSWPAVSDNCLKPFQQLSNHFTSVAGQLFLNAQPANACIDPRYVGLSRAPHAPPCWNAGDNYRVMYEQLSKDPNSLANLDQDLPNYAQHSIPIFSLPQEWLWCESWCGNETKAQVGGVGRKQAHHVAASTPRALIIVFVVHASYGCRHVVQSCLITTVHILNAPASTCKALFTRHLVARLVTFLHALTPPP